MADALREYLRRIMTETFAIDPDDLPTAPTPDNTKGWDSLAHMDLIDILENRFNVEISHADAVTLLSEDDIVSYLAARKIDVPARLP